MNNRTYTRDSLRWVLDREITILNFRTRELEEGPTELLAACVVNEFWLVEACVAFNKNTINTSDEDGWTPLHYACCYAHISVVKLLLESDAESSLYHKNRHGDIPIQEAIKHNKVEILKLLLTYHGKDKDMAIDNLGGALKSAAIKQNLQIVKLILGVSLEIANSRDSNGGTALHYSCRGSDETEVMEYLLESGAEVDSVDKLGGTPLFSAALYGRPELVKVLLAAGAAVNHRIGNGTPLDCVAALADRPAARAKVVEVLQAAGGLTAAELQQQSLHRADDA